MVKKKLFGLVMSLVLLISLTPALYAFSDVSNSKGVEQINRLKERGIVSGENSDKFAPQRSLTYAEAVSLLVKAFELDLSEFKFIKQPLASDYYAKVKDDAWYSDSFVIGLHNGIVLDSEINPNEPITREQFASLLMTQVDRQGIYPLIKMYVVYKDEDQVNELYKYDIQKLLLTKIGSLVNEEKFQPKQPITREDAAIWLEKALVFVDEVVTPHPEQPVLDPEKPILDPDQLKLVEEEVTKEIKKVTISTEVPHPGYSIVVSAIHFDGDIAYLDVQYVYPNPDMVYPQVITTAAAETYVSSKYTVKVMQ